MAKMIRRRTAIATGLTAGVLAPTILASNGWTQEPYPAGTTARIVVPFAAGGTTDILGRAVAQMLSQSTGATFFVDNRTGAGGNVGAEIVAKSAPDGTTLLLGTVATAVTNQYLYKYLDYDSVLSFTPVALVGELTNVLVVHPTFPAKTLREFVDYCKAQGPSKVRYGSSGVGGAGHLAMEYLQSLAGIKLEHVVYGGRSRMLRELLAGRILVTMDNLPPYMPHIRSGALRALGVSSSRRWFAVPEVPTIAEQGYAGFNATLWWYIAAPAGTRLTVAKKLSDGIVKGIKSEPMLKRIHAAGASHLPGDAKALTNHMMSEDEKWKKVVDAAGLRAQ